MEIDLRVTLLHPQAFWARGMLRFGKLLIRKVPRERRVLTRDNGFVLYFLRTEPEYGVQRLAAAPSFCMTESIPMVMKMKRWGEIEISVIAQLNNPDLNRARQAAETLSKYGGAKAETALWPRRVGVEDRIASRGRYMESTLRQIVERV